MTRLPPNPLHGDAERPWGMTMSTPEQEAMPSSQSQAPGDGMAPPAGPVAPYTREDIESPLQAARDPRIEQTTSLVDSGGGALEARHGNPASLAEKTTAGDVFVDSPTPFDAGMPGLYAPGIYFPEEP